MDEIQAEIGEATLPHVEKLAVECVRHITTPGFKRDLAELLRSKKPPKGAGTILVVALCVARPHDQPLIEDGITTAEAPMVLV